MNGQKDERLKTLLQAVPPGFLVDSRWLAARKIRRSSVHDYARRGWLDHVSHDLSPPLAARKSGQGAAGLASSRPLPSTRHGLPHPCRRHDGLAAKRLRPLSEPRRERAGLPLWRTHTVLDQQGADERPLHASAPQALRRLDARRRRRARRQGAERCRRGVLVELASPHIFSERAILEALDELPDHDSFHTLDVTFESLTTLRPRKLTALLAQCRSVKVKRLFFVFADRHDHAWRKHLQPEAVALGKGDRSLVKGGKLHSQYRITVPAEYAAPRRGGSPWPVNATRNRFNFSSKSFPPSRRRTVLPSRAARPSTSSTGTCRASPSTSISSFCRSKPGQKAWPRLTPPWSASAEGSRPRSRMRARTGLREAAEARPGCSQGAAPPRSRSKRRRSRAASSTRRHGGRWQPRLRIVSAFQRPSLFPSMTYSAASCTPPSTGSIRAISI